LESIQNSPLLEGLTKRGYDVLLLPEPIDEYCLGTLGKYDGKFTFTDISKEGVKLSSSEEKKLETLKEQYEPLTDYLQEALSEKVSKVQLSLKLAKAPCVIVAQSWGYSANMERIIKAQALRDEKVAAPVGGKRVLEINPHHPIIKRLLEIVENSGADDGTKDVAHVLYDTAVLNSGYALNEPKDLTGRINKMMATSMEIDPEAEIEEEIFEEDTEDEVSDDEEPDDEPDINQFDEFEEQLEHEEL